MKISVDLNPHDLFGKNAPFARHWQKAAAYPEEVIPEVINRCPRPKTLGTALFFFFVLYALVESAQYSVSGKFLTTEIISGPTYGPVFDKTQYIFKHVSFSQTGRSFAYKIPLWRLNELPYEQVRSQIINSSPKRMRPRLDKYIDYAFYYAQTYQVDPLWVLSIMWVESHFKPEVRSRVHARGLMQIMPGTAHYLNHLLDRPLSPKLAVELSKGPAHNIQLGTYYLGRLLRRFAGNHVYATVSYNMGPGFTLRRLRTGRPVGTRNLYLTKVRRAYSRLSTQIRKTLKYTPALHTQSYASIYKLNTLPDASFRLITWWNAEVDEINSKLSKSSHIEKVSGTF